MSESFPVLITQRMLRLGRDLDIPVFSVQAEAKLQAYLDSLEIYIDQPLDHDMRMIEKFILRHRWHQVDDETVTKFLNYVHVPMEVR